MSAWFSGELPSSPYGLPVTPTKATLPAYCFESSFITVTSCWQCGHQLANTSSSTGVETLARSNGPAVVDTENDGAVCPTANCAFLLTAVALCGTRLAIATATIAPMMTTAIVAYRMVCLLSG